MIKIRSLVDLQSLNTFKVKARAQKLIELDSIDDIQNALAVIQQHSERLILGGGSNLLFIGDFSGLVIYPKIFGIDVISEDENSVVIAVGASQNWHQLVVETIEQGWFGLENLALIPGNVGASPVQNIGAYGVEVESLIEQVECVDLDSGETTLLTRQECQFGYRDSYFKRAPQGKFLITKVSFKLSKIPNLHLTYKPLADYFSQQADITPKAVMQRVSEIRRQKLPDPNDIANAGSFFKNPVVGHDQWLLLKQEYPDLVGYKADQGMKLAAGWLIEKAGFKGLREGNIGVHRYQALVLVNYGENQGLKIWRLAQRIQDKIKAQFGVELEPEVRVLGRSDLEIKGGASNA